MKDYYAILGVVQSAEDVVIRAAWKALAQRYHPDRFVGNVAEANARMAEINEAYHVFSDPMQRKSYDQSRGQKERDFSDWEHEEAAGQAAGSFDPLEKDWALAVGFYPDLISINNRLSKISNLLAFTYRASLLDLKAFENRKELAEVAENLFLESYFGSHPVVIAFARRIIYEGNKAAAKSLNEAIRVLGSSIPADRIINKICKDFNVETEEMQKRRKAKEAEVDFVNGRQQKEAQARKDAENLEKQIPWRDALSEQDVQMENPSILMIFVGLVLFSSGMFFGTKAMGVMLHNTLAGLVDFSIAAICFYGMIFCFKSPTKVQKNSK